MCLLCQSRDPNVTTYDTHLDTGSGSADSVSATLPSYSLDQVGEQLTHGYWQSTGRDWRKFDASYGDTLTYDISGLDATGRSTALQAFEAWSAATGLNFVANTFGFADFVFTDHDSGAYSYSYLLGHTITQSYVNVHTGWQAYGGYYLQTYIHEIGHALGLGHGGNYNGAADWATDAHYQQDGWHYTIMSYFAQWENTYTNATYNYVGSAQLGDMVAMHWLYGTPDNVNTGDTVYGDGTNLSQTGMDLNTSWAVTIFDSAGVDTINLASRGNAQRLDLRGEQFSDINGEVGNLAIMRGAVIENAFTGNGNDTITGNEGDNHIASGGGNDVLVASLGNDTLDGGAGVDTVQLAGNHSDYSFGLSGQIRLSAGNSTIDLLSIETLSFADGTATLGSSADGATYSFTAIGAGYISTVVTFDTGGLGSWATLTDTFDAGGTLLTRVTLRDDGTSVTEDFTGSGSVVELTDDQGIYDWSTYSRTYDASGALVSSTMLMDNGVELVTSYADGLRTQVVATDTADVNGWASYTDTYTGGQRTAQSMTWDDGRVLDTLYNNGVRVSATMTDAAGDYAWSSYTDSFDASGARTGQSMTMDNGLVIETTYSGTSKSSVSVTDGANSFNWASYTDNFDASGTRTSQIMTLDNGLEITTQFTAGQRTQVAVSDEADLFSWASYTDTYDASGARTGQSMLLDSGLQIDTGFVDGQRRTVSMTDTTDSFVWQSTSTSFDATGAVIQQGLLLDDGRQIITDFNAGQRTQTSVTDTADVFGWDSYSDHFDFNGARVQQVLTLDSGMEIDTHYYATGIRSSVTVTDGGEDFFWSSYTTSYDTSGHATQRVLVLDNGSEITTHYAEPDYGLI
ncbi:M10 family metallopeptidase C-terminal domain-containing protein [Sagittula sp. S175]|uniref:M10 family metallopeptidase C-terminal domain-containing protein n=1 Tax=Sagittula sp. S175 TaxID=3415129 RepID=UPI003C7CF81D